MLRAKHCSPVEGLCRKTECAEKGPLMLWLRRSHFQVVPFLTPRYISLQFLVVITLLKFMLRSSRTSSMGLLDGLNSLQGAPPPSQSSASNPPLTANNDPFSQFSNGARSFFGDVSGSLAPTVDNVTETAKTSMSSLRRLMGEEDDIEAPSQMSLSEEMSTMFNLTMFQRIGLFAMCFGTGVLMIVLSFSFLPMIVLVPHKFAASFTLGNVLAILSTWILVGPRAQLQSMFHPVRAVAAGVYVFSLLFALFSAFLGGKLRYILVLVALVAEIVSLVWYALSYIPYGRHMISRVLGMMGISLGSG